MGSSSLTSDGTRPPALGNAESQPLDHQGSPDTLIKKKIKTHYRVSSELGLDVGQKFFRWAQTQSSCFLRMGQAPGCASMQFGWEAGCLGESVEPHSQLGLVPRGL